METIDSLLFKVLANQKHDGERLARLEEMSSEMKADVSEIKDTQLSCPARIAEMRRQARIAAWVTAGKILAWFVGIGATIAGAFKAVASIFGG